MDRRILELLLVFFVGLGLFLMQYRARLFAVRPGAEALERTAPLLAEASSGYIERQFIGTGR